jgi:hypothetical protein
VHNADKAFGTGAVAMASVATVSVAGEAAVQQVALPATIVDSPRGWTIGRQSGRGTATRRQPLTIEGQEIGSFQVSLACGEAPDTYQVAYDEKRMFGADGRIAGVRLTIQRETVPLRIESSTIVAAELVSSARGSVSLRMAQALASSEPPSLLVETLTLGKRATAIRVGPAGLADAFRDMAATCAR